MLVFAADYFGSKNVGPIYGLMLTAWGTASAVGPLLIAYLRQTTGSYHRPLHVIAGVMAISAVLPLLMVAPGTRTRRETELANQTDRDRRRRESGEEVRSYFFHSNGNNAPAFSGV